MTYSNARSKSASDLSRFRELVQTAERLDKQGKWDKAKAYYNAAMAMVLTKRIWFAPA